MLSAPFRTLAGGLMAMVRCDGDFLDRDRRLRRDSGMTGRPSGSEGWRRSGEVGPKGRSARRCARAGVRGHLQEVEDAASFPGQIAHGLGDAEPAPLDEADGEAAQSGHVLRPVAGSHPATVFVVGDVAHVVESIFESSIGLLLFQSKFPAFQISIQHTETRQ